MIQIGVNFFKKHQGRDEDVLESERESKGRGREDAIPGICATQDRSLLWEFNLIIKTNNKEVLIAIKLRPFHASICSWASNMLQFSESKINRQWKIWPRRSMVSD